MDIKCRKTSCKHNKAYTCVAQNVEIRHDTGCASLVVDNSKPAKDFSKNLFEADVEEYANSRHIREVDLQCHSCLCLFNKDGKCSANGITVLDEGVGQADCGTFVKK